MKLGDKVRFSRELVVNNISFNGSIRERWVEKQNNKPMTGIICGKRTIMNSYSVTGDPYEEKIYYFDGEHKTYQQVYLVATDLRGFHRVPEEWLEPIPEEDAVQELFQKVHEFGITIKTCYTCRYKYREGYRKPCCSCIDESNWEAQNES